MIDCLFCKIARKKKREDIVYEDSDFIAFRDAHPQAPVHLLIIPKEHLGIVECDVERKHAVCRKIFGVARKIAETAGIGGAYKLLVNAGYSASEGPDHLHVHLIGGWGSPTEVRHA